VSLSLARSALPLIVVRFLHLVLCIRSPAIMFLQALGASKAGLPISTYHSNPVLARRHLWVSALWSTHLSQPAGGTPL